MTQAEDCDRRRYHSPRRRAQAEATRLEILEAAERLFARQGFSATTMAALATAGGVAPKTVYVAFETKAGVVRALWNLRLRGDAGDSPVAERAWYREVLDEPDPERQLRLNAHNARLGKERLGVVLEVIRAAAPVDPEIDALWTRIQSEYHDNQAAVAASLAGKGALRPGLDAARAADILWTLNHPGTWQLLVGLRGWSPDEAERWFGDTAVAQLLP